MSCLSVVDSLRWLIIPISAVVCSPALADGLNCRHVGDSALPSLVCSDESNSDSDKVAWVSLRTMPRWGIHAGLTVIDLCMVPRSSGAQSDDIVLQNDDVKLKSFQSGSGKSCERRYCTDVRRDFSLLINSVPIPIGWTAVSFWLGYRNHDFSIRCDAIVKDSQFR
ncbi:MAG: hypothetical protein RL189_3329 [Pseudomonadota bacterium]|jgi:hypothetical protein